MTRRTRRSGRTGARFARGLVCLAITAGGLVALAAPAAAAGPGPGDLDPTFGTAGVTVQAAARSGYSGSVFQNSGAAVDSSGRFVVAGADNGPAGQDSALARFNADGSPDATFAGGVTGTSTDESGTGAGDNYTGVAINTTTGDIYTISQYGFGGGNGRVRVDRHDQDGALVSEVVLGGGTGGVNSIVGLGIAVQPDGNVVVSGSESFNSQDFGRMYVVRLKPDLTFDTTFGTGGTAFAQFGNFRAVNQSLGLQPDGKIVIAGSVRSSGDNTGVARFTTTGQLDTGFGNGGEIIVDAGQGANEQATTVAVAPDGRIAIGGNFDPGAGFVALFDSTGALIPGFASGGIYRSTPGTALWEGGLTWDSAGRIVIDYARSGGFAVSRLDGTTATLDTAFGISGVAAANCSTSPFTTGVFATASRYVVTGGCNGSMMIAAFLAAPPLSVSNVAVSLGSATSSAGHESVDLTSLDASKLTDGAAALQASPLRGSPLRGSPLRGSPLRGSPLRGSPLRGSPLRGSPLRGSPLRGSPFPVPIPLSTIPLVQESPSDPTWDTVLAGTQYAGLPLQSVSLQQVLALDPAPAALNAISLAQIDLSQTPLARTSFTAMFLWGVPLSALPTPAGASSWCTYLATASANCSSATAVDPATWDLLDLELAGDNLSSYYASPVALAGVPLRGSSYTSPLGDVYLTDIQLSATPLGALPTTDPAVAALLTCASSCAPTLGATQDADPGAVSPTARLADAVALVPGHGVPSVSVGDLLAGLLRTEDLPVEHMPLDTLLQQAQLRTSGDFHHVLSFDRWCAAGPDPTSVDVSVPAGSRIVPASIKLTVAGADVAVTAPSTLTATTYRFALPGLCGGPATPHVALAFDVEPPVTLGTFTGNDVVHAADGDQSATATAATVDGRDTTDDNPATPTPMAANVLYTGHVSHPGDVDYWHLPAPPAGSTVTLSLSHLPADYDLVVYGAQADVPASPLRGSPLRGSPLRGSPVGDVTADDTTTAASSEALADVPMTGAQLRGTSLNRGQTDESVTLVVRSSDVAHGFDVQVSGFNGASSPQPYALRAAVEPGPAAASCPTTTLSLGAPGAAPAAPTGDEQTLILVNQQRMAALYGTDATTAMMAKLSTLAGRSDVHGLVVPVDSDATVRNAYAAWDAAPCSADAANGVVSSINALVDTLRPNTPQLRHVVIVGADNAIPMARVPDLTSVDNQVSYTGTVRYRGTDNDISAAFLDGYVLSDDPYGDFDPQPWLSGRLYVPDVGLGRLVETPADVSAAVDAYVSANGVLNPTSGFVTGYDFLSDAAQSILSSTQSVARGATGLIGSGWTARDAAAGINAAGGGIVSVNAHYDHYEALPADSFTAGTVNNLLTSSALSSAQQGTIMFTIGCEGGLNVPDTLVSAPSADEAATLADWPQTATGKGAVYTGNTGYGYGDTDAIAYSERVYAYYAQNVASKHMTVGQALMFAKQRYNGELGVAGVYDAKALEEAVTYGLPMYRIGSTGGVGAVALPPLPSAPVTGTAAPTPFSLASISTTAVTDPHGTHWEVPGQVPQATQRRPIEPRMTIAYPRTGDQRVHGVVITSATSTDIGGVNPAYSTPTVDSSANEPELSSPQAVFPAALQAVNSVATADGPVDDVVLMPGQFFADPGGSGTGTQRLFSALGGTVYKSSSSDFDAPGITGVTTAFAGTSASVSVSTDATDLMRGVALYRDDVSPIWREADLTVDGSALSGSLPVDTGSTQLTDLTVQVVDQAGNVGISTNKGIGYRATAHTTTIALATQSAQPASGWFTGPVGVVVTADGPVSVSVDGGAQTPYTGPITVTGDGTHTVVASAGALSKQLTFAIDSTAPVITGLTDGQTLLAGSTVTVLCSDPQPGSGLAGCTGGGRVDTTSVGRFTRSVTATDKAGNQTGRTLHYSIVAFTGFEPPLRNGVYNKVVRGTAVPIMFGVTTADNTKLTDPAQLQVTVFAMSCNDPTGTPGDPVTAKSKLMWSQAGRRFVDLVTMPHGPGCIGVSYTYQSLVLGTAKFQVL